MQAEPFSCASMKRIGIGIAELEIGLAGSVGVEIGSDVSMQSLGFEAFDSGKIDTLKRKIDSTMKHKTSILRITASNRLVRRIWRE
jgi:hypothetical protein